MRKTMSKLFTMMVLAGLAAGPALADDTKPAPPPETAKKKAPPPAKEPTPEPKPPQEPKEAPRAPAGAAAEVKAGTGIAKREAVGEADSFTAGSKVWVWSSITGAKDQALKHVWKKDDKVIWEKEITPTSGRYRTWTRRTVKPGSYTVEVQGTDGAVLGSVSFTVT
jgi:hypothetical protein